MMRLSEAIRLGGIETMQAFGYLYVNTTEGPKTCALGSAFLSAGYPAEVLEGATFLDTAIYDTAIYRKIPSCRLYPVPVEWMKILLYRPTAEELPPTTGNMSHQIMFLNDRRRKSRTLIADWVEEIENAHPELYDMPEDPAGDKSEQREREETFHSTVLSR